MAALTDFDITITADSLKAEADALAFDREPGDVQFDDESGEGENGTITARP